MTTEALDPTTVYVPSALELKAREGIRALLELMGEDPDRDGLADTPKRVVKAYAELGARPGDPALLYCPESGGQPGEDNTTHHLVWTRPGAPCRYCGQTRQQLREAMRT